MGIEAMVDAILNEYLDEYEERLQAEEEEESVYDKLWTKAHEGRLTMFEVWSAYSDDEISHEQAEALAGIVLDC